MELAILRDKLVVTKRECRDDICIFSSTTKHFVRI